MQGGSRGRFGMVGESCKSGQGSDEKRKIQRVFLHFFAQISLIYLLCQKNAKICLKLFVNSHQKATTFTVK